MTVATKNLPNPETEPTISFRRALALCGIGATAGYALLKASPEQLPFPVIKVGPAGRIVKVPSRSVLRLLDADPPP